VAQIPTLAHSNNTKTSEDFLVANDIGKSFLCSTAREAWASGAKCSIFSP